MSIFVLMLTTCDLENNNLLCHLMNRLVMLNSDEETAIIVLVMDYLVRKIRSASRIPKQVSTFTGCDRMMNLLQGHDGRFECIGAIDGTHIPCVVPANLATAYCNTKGYTSQNVLAIVDFDLKFTYMVAGWEGSVHDARVLLSAQRDPAFSFPKPPPGKYYLVDFGYANRIGYLAPYRGTKYHLHDWRRLGGDRKKGMFNFCHASLRMP
ncbi:hypothetical protein UlMin_020929 [Ulmus minor]